MVGCVMVKYRLMCFDVMRYDHVVLSRYSRPENPFNTLQDNIWRRSGETVSDPLYGADSTMNDNWTQMRTREQ